MRHRSGSGFTLVEMAIVLAIVGILLFGGLSVAITQIQEQKIADTKKALADAKEALIGYAAGRPGGTPFLPCPDTDNDGVENRAAGVCTAPLGGLQAEGTLPWATLGVTGVDAWGHRFRYSVTRARAADPATTGTVADGIHLQSVGTINVLDNSTGVAINLALAVPVVILSHGKDGWGSISSSGIAAPAPPATYLDEIENTNSDNRFFANSLTEIPTAPRGEFDDLVTWLPMATLVSRLAQAGRNMPNP